MSDTVLGLDTQQQFQAAHALQSVLLVFGVLFLGAGLGYWMALQAAFEAGCMAGRSAPLQLCYELLPALNSGVTWCLVAGVVSLVAAGAMRYGLVRVME